MGSLEKKKVSSKNGWGLSYTNVAFTENGGRPWPLPLFRDNRNGEKDGRNFLHEALEKKKTMMLKNAVTGRASRGESIW